MKFLKASMIAIGFAAAFVLGVWTSPYIQLNSGDDPHGSGRPAVATATPVVSAPETARLAASAPRAAARAIPASSEEVLRRAKPLLNHGADMQIASSGFRDAQTFMTTAHVAHNTKIPFMVLKHRLLEQGSTLTAVVRAEKPELDAAREVSRAAAAARADLAEIAN